MNVATRTGSGGTDLQAERPIAGSVAGSPFTSGGASIATPELTGLIMVNVLTNPIHVRFGKGATPVAVATDMQIGPGIFFFPCDGHKMAMLQQTAAATVYVERCAEDGE